MFHSGLDFTTPLGSRLLDLNAAAELLQHILSGVMIDNEHTIFLIRPFVPLEHGHWWCGPRNVWQCDCDFISFANLELSFTGSVYRCWLKIIANSVEGGPRSFLEALPKPQAVLLAIQQRVRRAVHGLATGWHRDRRSPRAAAVPDPRASGPQDLAPGALLRSAH